MRTILAVLCFLLAFLPCATAKQSGRAMGCRGDRALVAPRLGGMARPASLYETTVSRARRLLQRLREASACPRLTPDERFRMHLTPFGWTDLANRNDRRCSKVND